MRTRHAACSVQTRGSSRSSRQLPQGPLDRLQDASASRLACRRSRPAGSSWEAEGAGAWGQEGVGVVAATRVRETEVQMRLAEERWLSAS